MMICKNLSFRKIRYFIGLVVENIDSGCLHVDPHPSWWDFCICGDEHSGARWWNMKEQDAEEEKVEERSTLGPELATARIGYRKSLY